MRRPLASLLALGLVAAACAGSDSEMADEPETAPDDADDAEDDDADDTSGVDDEPGGEAGDGALGGDVGAVPASVSAASITPSRNIGLAASVSVEADAPVGIRLSATSGDHVVTTPATAAIADAHELPLVGMRPDRTYDVVVHLLDEAGDEYDTHPAGQFTTDPVPAWFADHEIDIIDADRMSPGFTLVEFDRQFAGDVPDEAPSPQYLVAYDDEAEIVWWYLNTGTIAGVEQTPAGTFLNYYWPFGIRETDLLGDLVGHWRPQPRDVPLPDGEADAELAVADVDPDQVAFTGGFEATIGNPGDLEATPFVVPWMDISGIHHEAWPMPNGNVLTLSYTEHELTPEQRATFCPGDDLPFNAISDVIVEFEPDGTVLRTWDLWDAIDIDEVPGNSMCVAGGIFAGENNRDWTHANSVVYDPGRDAVIISSRHTDQIIAFDHLDDIGHQTQVRWVLGEAATIPLDGEPSYHQHAVEVMDDGNLVLYDNGNTRPTTSQTDPDNPPYSRAVIYEVDDASEDRSEWTARQVWEHVDETADGSLAYSVFISDADQLANGNILVTHGGIGAFPPDPADPLKILIREVAPSGSSGGDVVWELRSDPDVPHVTFRAERIESFYTGPLWAS
ncbi:MAG: aryl-sulfate sulfotransferase [Actinomycetota bacterium]